MALVLYVCRSCGLIVPPRVNCPKCSRPLATEIPAFLVGRTLGPYLIEKQLGAGAMGAVYQARGGEPERRAAVKFMVPDDEDELTEKRFLREARILAQLKHPHVVEVYDCAASQWGPPYLAMELLEGRSLRELLRERPRGMPLEEALRHARQLAEALDFAHRQGVVHRDLKPENIFVVDGPDGPVDKILDFGLAKSLLRDREPRLTASGIVLGTPAYITPEQLWSRPLGPQTDQYALGLIVAELLTGRKVRQGMALADIVMTEAERPLAPERLAGVDLPPYVTAALIRSTQPRPEDRFPDVADFLRALQGETVAPAPSPAAPPAKPAPTPDTAAAPPDRSGARGGFLARRWGWLVLGAALAAAVLAVLALR